MLRRHGSRSVRRLMARPAWEGPTQRPRLVVAVPPAAGRSASGSDADSRRLGSAAARQCGLAEAGWPVGRNLADDEWAWVLGHIRWSPRLGHDVRGRAWNIRPHHLPLSGWLLAHNIRVLMIVSAPASLVSLLPLHASWAGPLRRSRPPAGPGAANVTPEQRTRSTTPPGCLTEPIYTRFRSGLAASLSCDCCLARERVPGAGARWRSRGWRLQGESGAGVHHRCAPGVDGGDDFLGVDPFEVGAGG